MTGIGRFLHDTADRVPVALQPADDLRRDARRHQRARRAGTAAASFVAVMLVAAMAVSATQGGNRKAAPPAEDPPLTEQSLLITDELEPQYSPLANEWLVATTGEGDPASATSCDQSSMEELGATHVWHRTFVDVDALREAKQVTAEFPTPAAAKEAFAAIASWFDSCADLKQPVWRYPAATTFGAEIRAVTVLRDAGTEWPSTRYESVGYGLAGSALTLVSSTTESPDDGPPQQDPEARPPFRATMQFAVRRLAGSRNVPENAVPTTFVFEEEKLGPDGKPRMNGDTRHYLGDRWRPAFCQWLPWRAGDAYRSGFVNSGQVSRYRAPYTSVQLQLALYENEEMAQRAVEDLRAAIIDCGSAASSMTVHPVQLSSGSHDVYVIVEERENGRDLKAAGRAVTVARRGNAVFLPSAEAPRVFGATPAEIAKLGSVALEQVTTSLENNLDRVCDLASRCG